MWKSSTKIYLEHPPGFTNNIKFIFPLYFRGGKFRYTYYRLFSSLDHWYNPDYSINQDQKFEIEVPSAYYNKVGVELHTGFTNKLTDEFKVYFPQYYYEIDLSKIDYAIQAKAKQIVNSDTSDKPDYYKIGQFVYHYMTYTKELSGKDLSLKEIFEGKKGVCKHYVYLYNAMLNSIGIKTLYISGWAMDGEETSSNEDSTTHAWTAALIKGKWIELDPTWGLFEGVPASHIMKNFNSDNYYYRCTKKKSLGPNFIENVLLKWFLTQKK